MIGKYRIILSGAGGQGIITSSIVLAEAAVLHEGLEALQSQSYGAEARGGASRADVIISDQTIFYPQVLEPNILVCLTQQAYSKFNVAIRPGGTMITDSQFVIPSRRVDARQIALPLYESVMDRIGNPIVFNICMLGAMIELTLKNVIAPESVLKVLAERFPPKVLEMNRRALELGRELALNY